LAFGPRCNPGTPSLIGLPKWPPCPVCCLAQHSNLAIGHGPELRIPVPMRNGEEKGQPEQCGRRWLHAHENHSRRCKRLTRPYASSNANSLCKIHRGRAIASTLARLLVASLAHLFVASLARLFVASLAHLSPRNSEEHRLTLRLCSFVALAHLSPLLRCVDCDPSRPRYGSGRLSSLSAHPSSGSESPSSNLTTL
jgi:hypothetical protein